MITDRDCGPRIVENVGSLLSSYDIIDRCCLCYAHGRTKVMQQNGTKINLGEAKFPKIFLGAMPPDPPTFTYLVEARG